MTVCGGPSGGIPEHSGAAWRVRHVESLRKGNIPEGLYNPTARGPRTERSVQWRTEGGQGGHGPRAQALEGAPGQLVGASFKKKIRPR